MLFLKQTGVGVKEVNMLFLIPILTFTPFHDPSNP